MYCHHGMAWQKSSQGERLNTCKQNDKEAEEKVNHGDHPKQTSQISRGLNPSGQAERATSKKGEVDQNNSRQGERKPENAMRRGAGLLGKRNGASRANETRAATTREKARGADTQGRSEKDQRTNGHIYMRHLEAKRSMEKQRMNKRTIYYGAKNDGGERKMAQTVRKMP